MKKLISIILALVMALSLCVTTTWADEPAPDYTWYGNGTADTFELKTINDYLGFVKLTRDAVEGITTAATNFANKTVKLQCDVDFAGMDFYKADSTGTTSWVVENFFGTFDAAKDAAAGTNYTIKNLTYTISADATGNQNLGVFNLMYGTIQNLNVENVTLTSASSIFTRFGGIAKYVGTNGNSAAPAEGGLDNCHVNNISLSYTGTFNNPGNIGYDGGLAGLVDNRRTINNCTVSNFKLTTGANALVYKVGGLIGDFCIGSPEPNVGSLKNCRVDGFTVNAAALAGHLSGTGRGDFGGIGGLLGYASCDKNVISPIENCVVTGVDITVGKMYNDSFTGGFLGMSRHRYTVKNCSVEGRIAVGGNADGCTSCFVGGFCGAPTGADITDTLSWLTTEPAVTFTNCSARVDITAGGACTVGGFAGLVGGSFKENNTGHSDYVGKNTATFINCTSGGTITSDGTGSVGGFAGKDMARGAYNACGNGGLDAGGNKLDAIGLRTQADGSTGDTGFNSRTTDMPDQELNSGVNPYQVFSAPVEQTASQEPITVDLAKKAFQPTREGYKFVGWSTSEGGDPITDDTILVELGGENSTTYYALWELIPVVTPPEDQMPEPDQEPAVSGHEPIRRQHTTMTVEDTTADTGTDDAGIDTVTSAKTADIGAAVYGVMAVLSMTGSGWIVGRKRR